jgi:hypothetical protein
LKINFQSTRLDDSLKLTNHSDGMMLWLAKESPMAQDNSYEYVIVETFIPASTSNKYGRVHVRPIPGGKYPVTVHVECAKRLSTDYPIGTRFKLLAKLTDRENGGEFLYSSYRWEYEVLK